MLFLGWCLPTVRSSDSTDETKSNCDNITHTDPKRQKEDGLVGCPDNQSYFLIVSAAFIGGLVVSYIVLKFIIRCSQIGVPKKGAKKKEEKKKEGGAAKKKEPAAATSSGTNGGLKL